MGINQTHIPNNAPQKAQENISCAVHTHSPAKAAQLKSFLQRARVIVVEDCTKAATSAGSQKRSSILYPRLWTVPTS
eukprot:scaffold183586_cov19-Tisochrysis_lutea.AAC.1